MWRGLVGMLVVCVAAQAASAEELREWTIKSKQGAQKLRARAISLVKNTVTLVDEDGAEHKIALAALSARDKKEALIRIVGSGVVEVQTKNPFGEPSGKGSGFVFTKDGRIMTNYHVIRGAGFVEVTFRDSETPIQVVCLAVDRDNDVAILKLPELPPHTHVLSLSVQSEPSQGDRVWAVGHPRGYKNSVSWGDVNAIRATADMPEEFRQYARAPKETRWLQTDAVIARGSSGGPLLNEQGQAIGMNTFVVRGEGIAFALSLRHTQACYQASKSGEPLTLPLAPAEGESAFDWASAQVVPALRAYLADLEEYQKALSAKLPPEELEERRQVLCAKHREGFLRIIHRDPSGWPAFQALLYGCNVIDDTPSGKEFHKELCHHALTHHSKHAQLNVIVQEVAKYGLEESAQFCRDVIQNSPHRHVRATAYVSLGGVLLRHLQQEDVPLVAIHQLRREAEQTAQTLQSEFAQTVLFLNQLPVKAGKLSELITAQLESIRIGVAAQEIEGLDAEGESFKLSDYRGRVVLLDFFANWCPHCTKMYANSRKLVTEMQDRPFAMLGVNTDHAAVLQKIIADGKVTWRTWSDTGEEEGSVGPITTNWKIAGYPSLVLIDHNGIVRRQFSGTPDPDAMNAAIETLVKEAESEAEKTPPTETPSTETPSTETPSTETPSTETPSTETPSTETPDRPDSE